MAAQQRANKSFGMRTKNYTVQLCKDVKKDWMLYLILLPVVANFVIFHYIPMYGAQIAFRKYNIILGITGSPWVGFKNFVNFFTAYNFWTIIGNTIILSGLQILIGFPMPILFALLLNELTQLKFKKFAQTVSYLPHFISAVVVVGMVIQFTSISGPINKVIQALGMEPVYFMGNAKYFRPIFIIMSVWQNVGYGAIVYLAAISSINPELYEVAAIDGASRLRKIWSITLPSIASVIIILLIMRMGSILNVEWMKILLLQNSSNVSVSEVLGTFVYKRGFGIADGNASFSADYSYATAAGLFNSVVGLAFVLTSNYIAKKTSETSLF